jgi:hypothetical protein
MNECVTKSCGEAKVYFENSYNTLYKKVLSALKKAKKGTVQFDV